MTAETVPDAVARMRNALAGLHDPDVGACVTLVAGCTNEEVLRAFGADPDGPTTLLDEVGPEDPVVVVRTATGGVAAVEPDYGWYGTSSSVLVRASRGGRAASISWSDTGETNIGFAVDGQESPSSTDLLDVDELSVDPTVAALLGDLRLDDLDEEVEYRALVLLERWTGVALKAAPTSEASAVHRFDPSIALSRDSA